MGLEYNPVEEGSQSAKHKPDDGQYLGVRVDSVSFGAVAGGEKIVCFVRLHYADDPEYASYDVESTS